MSRPQAISILRDRLRALCDDDQCACAAASHFGLFCKGFGEMTDAEYRKRFDWIARKRPKATRQELEKLVSLYHIGRQQVDGVSICCDAETREHCGCDGWNMFDNRAIERFCWELTGRRVLIS